MPKHLTFYFDVGSPASYLAYTQLPRLADRTKAEIVWKPMLLGGVFQATGNHSPATIPAKSKWMNADMARWARRYGVPFEHNPHFPINTLMLQRGAVGMQRQGQLPRYLAAIFTSMWAEPVNLGDPGVLAEVLTQAGFDPAAFQAMVADPAVKDALKAITTEAVERGVFGAPTILVGDELFWGNDRLDFVEEALRG